MNDASRTQSEDVEVDVQIERRHHQPDLCTIYESNVSEMRKMARWITAKGDAFVDAGSYR